MIFLIYHHVRAPMWNVGIGTSAEQTQTGLGTVSVLSISYQFDPLLSFSVAFSDVGRKVWGAYVSLCLATSEDWDRGLSFGQPCEEGTGHHGWPSLGLVPTPATLGLFRAGVGRLSSGC